METEEDLRNWILDLHENTPEWIGFEITKSKTDQVGKTCDVYVSSGHDTFTPAQSLISLAADRINRGEKLGFDSPIFAYHETVDNNTVEAIPLSYETILKMDKVRSEKLGLPCGLIKTHCRRKGGASAFAALRGIGMHKVKIMARWSLGVQDAYIKLRVGEIVTLQNRAIRWALNRLANGFSTFIFD